jgi:hypothetical protein
MRRELLPSNSLFFAVAVFGMGVMLGLDALVSK